MIATAWRLGRLSACGEQLRRWAHMFGFGGHFLTKSRRYSVTFGQLRAVRREHRRAQHQPDGERDPWGRPLDDTVVLILKTWQCTSFGYTTPAEADLAMPLPPALANTTKGPSAPPDLPRNRPKEERCTREARN